MKTDRASKTFLESVASKLSLLVFSNHQWFVFLKEKPELHMKLRFDSQMYLLLDRPSGIVFYEAYTIGARKGVTTEIGLWSEARELKLSKKRFFIMTAIELS